MVVAAKDSSQAVACGRRQANKCAASRPSDEPEAEMDQMTAYAYGKQSHAGAASNQEESTEATREAPCPVWLNDVKSVNDTGIPMATRLSHEINSFAQYTNDLVNSVRPAVDAAIVSMSECVQSIWPEASVVCFGSFANGLWLPSSDIDVVIMGIPNEDINSKTSSKFLLGIKELEQIAGLLKQQPWIQSIDVVRSAKVPVAKLVLLDSDLRMDISIENVHTRLGIEASHVVRDYVDAIPTLYPMIIVLKQFLREKGLNIAFTGGLSSYCVALMAAFFIQREGQVEAPLSEVGQLLLNFLEYYSMVFDYRTMGISLKPEAFGEYMLAAHLTMTNGVPLMPKLVIDDPVYLDGQHNAAAGAFAIARVIAAFENAFYAVSFHRATKFTPTPLCQMLHWTGHSASLQSTPPS